MNNMAMGKRILEETKVSVQALRLRGVKLEREEKCSNKSQ